MPAFEGLLTYRHTYDTICAMKRTALFLKEDQVKKLQKLSEKTGAPVAELIRRAIDKYLQERAKELK
jgi:metal-responsive CopG/Arc/MetJ family transcriptional regulator